MSKKIFVFLILISLIVFGFLIFNHRKIEKIEVKAESQSDPPPIGKANVSGFAWSENIGWISFKKLVPQGVMADWRFDEGEGEITYDETVNNNDGYLGQLSDHLTTNPNFVPTWKSEAECKFGKCLGFDGNDYVRVYNNETLNLTTGISIEAWIKGSASGFSTIKESTGAGARSDPQFQVVGDKIYYVWKESDGAYYQIWTGTMNTDGTDWVPPTQLTFTDSNKFQPQLQVVKEGGEDKIYYVWREAIGGVDKFWTGKWDLVTNDWDLEWSENPKVIKEHNIWLDGPQLQVVGDTIYYTCHADNGWPQYFIYTGKMNTDGTGLTWFPYTGYIIANTFPRFQVVGSKIYFIYECDPTTGSERMICTGEMKTDGTEWQTHREMYDTYDDIRPKLQVVGDKIYYIWYVKDATGYHQIYVAKMNIGDPNSWEIIHSTDSRSDKWYPQFQVVGDKIHCVWREHDGSWNQIVILEMDTDGTPLASEMTTTPSHKTNSQFQIVGSKSYYVWGWGKSIYTGEKDSNIISKGDFYGLGVKEVGGVDKVVGFINAGVDGFKYKGEAIDDTAGATVSSSYVPANWNHVVLTYDKTELKLYLNGAPQDTFSFTKDINVNPFDLIIGDDFIDIIDEVRIYDRALSPGEVSALYDPYGVNIDPSNGELSGYAWSENIGWISFNRTDTSTPPSSPYNGSESFIAKLEDNQVFGWARALAYGDGWDGWIKLRGTTQDGNSYGVWLDTSVSPIEFRGWAWGSDVIGWVSFNCSNRGVCTSATAEGGPSDYKVITSLSLPTASNLSFSDKYCNVQSGVGQIIFQWFYEDPEDVAQSNYHLQIATDSGFSNKVLDCKIPQSRDSGTTGDSTVKVVSSPSNVCNDGGLLGDRSLEISYRGAGNPYYWRIKVKSGLFWSAPVEGSPFETPSHAYPWCDFTWSPQNPSLDEIIQLTDLTTFYDTALSWDWDFDNDGVTDSTLQNPTHSYSTPGNYTVTLEACDNTPVAQGGPYCCPKSRTITVTLPLPEWKEIAPF